MHDHSGNSLQTITRVTGDDVYVDVRHGLVGTGPVIDQVVLGVAAQCSALRPGDIAGYLPEVSACFPVQLIQTGYGREGADQNMAAGHGVNVHEGNAALVPVHNACWQFTADDLREDGHGFAAFS